MYRTPFCIINSIFLFLILCTNVYAVMDEQLLKVTSPETGKVFQVGDRITITWNSLYKSINEYMNQNYPVKIVLHRQVAANQVLIVDSLKDIGSYTWTIPDSLDKDTSCRIYVCAQGCPYGYGYSQTFSIKCPNVFALKNFTKDTTLISGAFYAMLSQAEKISLSWIAKGDVPRIYDLYYNTADSSAWTLYKENWTSNVLNWDMPANKKTFVQFMIKTHNDTFTLNSGIITILPTPIRIELPRQVTTNRPVFQWHPSDKTSEYIIEVADALSGKIKSAFCDTVNDTFYTPDMEFSEGSYYWRVVPYYTFYSGISNLKEFSEFRIKFEVPQLIAPSVNPTRERKPLFAWYKTPYADNYKISFASDSLFSSIIDSSSTTDTFYTPSKELPFGVTYWKVSSPQITGSSRISKITVVPDTLPCLSAFNGDSLSNEEVTFKWSPVKNASSYKVVIYKQAQVLSKRAVDVNTNNVNTSVVLTQIISDTFFTPAKTFQTGSYSWSVSSDKNFDEYTYYDEFVITDKSTGISIKTATDKQLFQIVTVSGHKTLQFQSNASNRISLRVFDLKGKLIYSNPEISSSLRLQNICRSGMYIIRVSSGKQTQAIKTYLD